MAETTYEGGCHCGAVKYRVTASFENAIVCNCSICSKTGSKLAFAPAARFELVSGEGALTDYQFGKKRIHHLFCSRCGIRSFARAKGPDGTDMVAVNLNCVEGLDPSKVKLREVDGRSVPLE